jgi:hypothetical protein
MRAVSAPGEPLSTPPPRCANCGAEVPGRYCGACGQERSRSLRIPFHRLAGEAAGELLSVDSRIGRTLPPLFLEPGSMTRAWLDGRRASHTSPVKLYLVCSFLFFLAGALRPDAEGSRLGAGGDREVRVDEEALQELRASGAVGARVAARLGELAALPPGELGRRTGAGLRENLPKAMFALVPALALFLRLAYLRAGIYLAEHLVFALHAHAVAFALLLPGAATGHPGAQSLGFGLAAAHGVVALRRAYGGTWRGTVGRAAVAGLLYLIALGLALAVAGLAALALA